MFISQKFFNTIKMYDFSVKFKGIFFSTLASPVKRRCHKSVPPVFEIVEYVLQLFLSSVSDESFVKTKSTYGVLNVKLGIYDEFYHEHMRRLVDNLLDDLSQYKV